MEGMDGNPSSPHVSPMFSCAGVRYSAGIRYARSEEPGEKKIPESNKVKMMYCKGNGRWRPGEGFGFACRLGCQWGYYRAWIVCSPIAFVGFSLVDLIFISRYF